MRTPRLVAALMLSLAGCRSAPAPVPLAPEARLPLPPVGVDGMGTVVGLVADSAFGGPIIGAHVAVTPDTITGFPRARVLPAPLTDTTTTGGGFTFRAIPPGTYRISARQLGYDPAEQVVVIAAAKVDTVVLRLPRVGGVRARP